MLNWMADPDQEPPQGGQVSDIFCISQLRLQHFWICCWLLGFGTLVGEVVGPHSQAQASEVETQSGLIYQVSGNFGELDPLILAERPSIPALRGMNLLFVDPARGNDRSGQGTEDQPFQSITYAISQVGPNTAIVLAPGTYSSATGEVFPLVLPAQVRLQGNPDNRGQQIIIEGGGDFTTQGLSRQNLTVVAGDRAVIDGVTITNSNSQGYGLLIQSGMAVISNNTFKKNTLAGISIWGNAAPKIDNNYLADNPSNGVVIYGRSRAELLNNFFDANGFGINITEQSRPLVRGNRIVGNKDGVVIQDNSQPILRLNSLERNQRDGLVLVGQASVNLGESREPGGNIIRNNQRYNLNNTTLDKEILSVGNELSLNQNRGNVKMEKAGSNTRNDRDSKARFNSQEVALEVSGYPGNSRRSTGDDQTERLRLGGELEGDNYPNLPQKKPDSSNQLLPGLIQRLRSGSPSNLLPIVNESNNNESNNNESNNNELDNNESNNLGVDSLPSSGLLPVPNARIPSRGRVAISNRRRRRPIWQSSAGTPPPPLSVSRSRLENDQLFQPLRVSSTPANLGLRYRVVVEIGTENIESSVRKIVPQAFRTVVNGRDVIQAGAFREWSGAYRLLQRLRLNGLSAEIEPI